MLPRDGAGQPLVMTRAALPALEDPCRRS